MSDPSDSWDIHCAKQERCNGERLGTCPVCGWDVGDEDIERYELVNNRRSHFHEECYRETYMAPCDYCSEWIERALIDPATGECRECKAALDADDERRRELV